MNALKLVMFLVVVCCVAHSQTVITFDNPAPPSGPNLNGQFQGINFGTGQWAWEGPYSADSSNNIFFSSNVNSRTFAFVTPAVLTSLRAFTGVSGTLTLSDDKGQTRSQTITTNGLQTVTTGWTQPSNAVTVSFTSGWELGLDDISYNTQPPPPPPPPPPAVAISVAPQVPSGATLQFNAKVTGNTNTAATWSATAGTVDGTGLFTAPNVAASTDVTVTATSAADTSKSASLSLTVAPGATGARFSVRFPGVTSADLGLDVARVKIRIDDPTQTADIHPAMDIGATDFTIEFWVKGSTANNSSSRASSGAVYGWINGNIIFDRDRFNQGSAFGISFGCGTAGNVAFGIKSANGSSFTVCGNSVVLNDAWHHVAVTREANTSQMRIFVDGALDASAVGPSGDIHYPANGVPTNDCSWPSANSPCTYSDPFVVLGAEKHDVDANQFPSFTGLLDELRVSSKVRYTTNFQRPTGPFTPDADTAALYHFDEGGGSTAFDSSGISPVSQNAILKVGGANNGPTWSSDTPF